MTQKLTPSVQLMELLFGSVITSAIGAAAKLCIADLLKEGAKTAEELARHGNLHPRSLYRVLRVCASVGVFSEDTDRRFSLTPLSEPLLSDAPNSLRAYAQVITTDWQFPIWAELPYTIRTGKPSFEKAFGMSAFDYLWTHPEAMKEFNDSMTSSSAFSIEAVLDSYDFSEVSKLVDVGGGQGLLLASIIKKYPHMKGILFDVPAVVEEAREIINSYGVTDRCEIVGGDFFASVPTTADASIMKFVIHDWNDEQCITILRNCRNALPKGGKILVVEMVLPEGNEPSIGKYLDVHMMLYGSGCERTEKEYRELFDKAGFELSRIVPTMSPFSIVEGIYQ